MVTERIRSENIGREIANCELKIENRKLEDREEA
jgi:hypothetical protein